MRKQKNDLKNLLETFFGSHFILLLPKLLEREREREREGAIICYGSFKGSHSRVCFIFHD